MNTEGTMKERRKLTRRNLMSYSQVFDIYGGLLLGFLADLTESGAMVIGEKAVEPGREMTLSIELPELRDIQAHKLLIDARVVWCLPDISPEFQNIGLEFKKLNGEQTRIIQAIMANYEFTHEFPRYPMIPPFKR
jgi:Tfp pilus assembly protein PilZ